MAGAPWLKVQATISGDPKMMRAGLWGGIVFRALLEMTKAQGWNGAFTRGEVDAEILMRHFNVRESDLGGISRDDLARALMGGFERCVEVGLLRDRDGLIEVPAWTKHQAPDSTERVRAFRRRAFGLNEEIWSDMLAACGRKCLSCRQPEEVCGSLTPDHVIPQSKKGANAAHNIQPLCSACNSAKHTKAVDYRPKDWPWRKGA